jgi:hypothetical protein
MKKRHPRSLFCASALYQIATDRRSVSAHLPEAVVEGLRQRISCDIAADFVGERVQQVELFEPPVAKLPGSPPSMHARREGRFH